MHNLSHKSCRFMRNRIPSYRLHKPSGLAVVTLAGRDYYLGKHGSAESVAEYRRLTSLYVAGGMTMPPAPSSLTLTELALRYWDHAVSYYRKDGRPTSQIRLVRSTLRRVRALFGPTAATDFGPAALLALRESWVLDGNSRTVVNRKVRLVRQVIDWAVAEGLVPGPVSHAVRAVHGLARGRTPAPERDPVRPVDDAAIEAALDHLQPRMATMVQLQLLTGMRPGEVCSIRPRDLDRSGRIWIYTPAHHKAEHHGRARTIAIGPRAQAILSPWLHKDPADDYPLSRSGRGPVPVSSYHRAITQACRAAGIEPWAPNRLRHNFATEVRRRFGLDAAQVCLGHADADVTQVYAEADRARAAEVAAAIG